VITVLSVSVCGTFSIKCCNVFRRRSRSKKSQKDAVTGAVNAADMSLDQMPSQSVATDPLPSGPSLLLPLKQEPGYESSNVPDSGMQFFCESVKL